jgi:hypothetical protein
MKIKNGFYILLLLMACKDGGQVPEIAKKNDWAWSFNKELANKYLTSTAANSFSFSTEGTKFVVQSASPLPCNQQGVEVKIDNLDIPFSTVSCYSVNAAQPDEDPFYLYVISASRNEANRLYLLTYAFQGQSPDSQVYRFGTSMVSASYVIYNLSTDSNGQSYYRVHEYFSPYSGSVNLVNIFGRISISSQSSMRGYFSLEKFQLTSRLACCQ